MTEEPSASGAQEPQTWPTAADAMRWRLAPFTGEPLAGPAQWTRYYLGMFRQANGGLRE
jgi:hypothetical protein